MVGLILSTAVLLFHLLGIISSISALRSARTSQGTIAWLISLNTFPYIVVPLYWIFGRTHFQGYLRTRNEVRTRLRTTLRGQFSLDTGIFAKPDNERDRVVERIARIPFLNHNKFEILIDGERTFQSMFEGVRRATSYVVAQFYIVRDDETGREFADTLIQVARSGVPVYLLYDEIGCYALSAAYLNRLRHEGISVSPFHSAKGTSNRFQINFRNHRKVVIVDGKEAWVGGLNIGDEYRGRSEKLSPWRDTHLYLSGPTVLGVQRAFLEDWHWATGSFPKLDWSPMITNGDGQAGTVVSTGPTIDQDRASLFFQHLIHSAKRRLWLTSPYFVPDEGVQDALKLAVLRGVDVRILIPQRPDHLLVYLSAFSFLGSMIEAGVGIYRYQPGFLHQKVFLVDHDLTGIGTINLDNRSFYLNFEIAVVVRDADVAKAMEAMLMDDFNLSVKLEDDELNRRPWWFRLITRAAYLTAPVL